MFNVMKLSGLKEHAVPVSLTPVSQSIDTSTAFAVVQDDTARKRKEGRDAQI